MTPFEKPAERRKLVRLKVRPDLQHVEQRYEGKRFHVVKDPVCLRYYRFNTQEYYVFSLFDGQHTMEDVRTRFEDEFRPHRLEFQDLESFARQLVTAGLVQHEQAGTGQHLFQRRAKQRRQKRFAALANILYWKIPVFDPDRLLTAMYKWLWWIFTPAFFVLSVALMGAAVAHVLLHFETFRQKMPEYQEFFHFRTVAYMWLSLGIVKIIHEFGHGLSCKAFKGECHEMGVLLMCFSPALYANVTDAWTVADKWKRIVISFAGIYVELVIAAIASFVWWYTEHLPVVNYTAMCLMVLCSVSTVMFNANPLMRFDGYYIMADWIEIPNLRDRANRFLNGLFMRVCLGVEQQPEGYMAPGRKWLFAIYAIASWIYRWVVTFSIVWFLSDFLNPKLKVLSRMLAVMSLASMFVWPVVKVAKNIRTRGRLPDMKPKRMYATLAVLAALLAAALFVPLPVSRVREQGLVALDPDYAKPVGVKMPGVIVDVLVKENQAVRKGDSLAAFRNPYMHYELDKATADYAGAQSNVRSLEEAAAQYSTRDPSRRLEADALKAKVTAAVAETAVKNIRERINDFALLKAPADGICMGVPQRSDLGRFLDPSKNGGEKPVMTIADPKRLIVRIPVSPTQYQLLKDDLAAAKGKPLAVDVHVPGRTDRVYEGRLRRMPDSDAKQVPEALTQRGGGPLAVKAAGEGGQETVPVTQTYLAEVELVDPDSSVRPGALVSVKVYCRWHSAAWWVRWKLAEALDLGFYQ